MRESLQHGSEICYDVSFADCITALYKRGQAREIVDKEDPKIEVPF